MAWRSKPEGKDVLSLSRLIRCQKLAGRTADDAVLTLKSFNRDPKACGGQQILYFLTSNCFLTANDLLTCNYFFRCVPTKWERHAELAAGSVDEAAKPNVHHQTNRQENKQRGRASVAHQRQRNAGDGHRAYHHRHVHQHMETERCCNAHYKKHSRAIFRALSILH